jgi:ATP-dependent RNA helicase DeaD
MMLRGAKIDVQWMSPPDAAQILAKDRERMLAALTAPAEIDEDDRELVEQVMAKLPPEAIAAALVRSLRTDLPAPEDIIAAKPDGVRHDPGPRPGFEDATWFRINAGRRHNADPRWLLPVICRYGHVGRADIGAIRIAANESYFQVTGRATRDFVKALRKATILPEDEGLVIEPAEPREAAAAQRPLGPPRQPGPRKPKR